MTTDKKTVVVVAKDGKRLIGMATLGVLLDFRGPSGEIDNVVVLEEFRGQGLGKKLCSELIAIARKKKLSSLALTSRRFRVAANKLYPKLGFTVRDTNAYELSLK